MIEAIKFVLMAWRAYRIAEKTGMPRYSGLLRHGVPRVCIFVATGREAWRISQRALEEWSQQ